jgi:hypothetical protein
MKPELLQSYLFKQALTEIEIESSFKIDHRQGFNYLLDKQYDIKYPKFYIDQINLLSKEKLYDYCFIGFIGNLGRNELLKKFISNKSVIKKSDKGRKLETKYNFDLDYYQTISNTKFSLCPNHIGDWYLHDRAWTYRYIESLFCKTIPIVFRKTPLGNNFLKDTIFLWDDENHKISNSDYDEIVEKNYQLSLKYWTFINGGPGV